MVFYAHVNNSSREMKSILLNEYLIPSMQICFDFVVYNYMSIFILSVINITITQQSCWTYTRTTTMPTYLLYSWSIKAKTNWKYLPYYYTPHWFCKQWCVIVKVEIFALIWRTLCCMYLTIEIYIVLLSFSSSMRIHFLSTHDLLLLYNGVFFCNYCV